MSRILVDSSIWIEFFRRPDAPRFAGGSRTWRVVFGNGLDFLRRQVMIMKID